nr:hypothetical protein [uncultured Sphingomonas sp.]
MAVPEPIAPDTGRKWLAFEWIMGAFIIACVIYTIVYLFINKHLPFTFFYDPDDLFADWFNTAYWAYDRGSYDAWTTLYPPLSFVFLDLLSLDKCYPARAFASDGGFGLAARYCDWLSYVGMFSFFLLNIIIVYLAFRKIDRQACIPRTIAVTLGWPMLNGLERGNLIIVAFTCMVFAFSPLLKSARLRWIFLGLAINFKVYLIGTLFAPLLRRKWTWVEGATVATIFVYLASYAILGRGTIFEIATNLQNWSNTQSTSPLDMWSATTYEALSKLLDSEIFSVSAIIGSQWTEFLAWFLPVLLNAVRLIILLAAIAIYLRPEVIPAVRPITLALCMALISTEAGGYTTAMITFLVMCEKAKGLGRKTAIALCYLLAVPADIAIDQVAPVVRDTFVGHSTTIIVAYIKLGPFIRPFIIDMVAVSLSAATIWTVWKDIRDDGLAGRPRLHDDARLSRLTEAASGQSSRHCA